MKNIELIIRNLFDTHLDEIYFTYSKYDDSVKGDPILLTFKSKLGETTDFDYCFNFEFRASGVYFKLKNQNLMNIFFKINEKIYRQKKGL